MPRIRCHYMDCVFLDDGYCGAAAVEIDPDTGCATFAPNDEAADKELEDEELGEWEEDEEEDDDSWLEEDEDEI